MRQYVFPACSLQVKKKKEKEAKEAKDGESIATPSSAPSTPTAPNFDSMMQKFEKLSYFDQHQVTAQCTSAVLDQIKSFTAGNSSYLPLGDNISFLFDLMQAALNINGLLDFIIRVSVNCVCVVGVCCRGQNRYGNFSSLYEISPKKQQY